MRFVSTNKNELCFRSVIPDVTLPSTIVRPSRRREKSLRVLDRAENAERTAFDHDERTSVRAANHEPALAVRVQPEVEHALRRAPPRHVDAHRLETPRVQRVDERARVAAVQRV